jgi:putative spermidine/putrescine transport system substrate-binding protein
MTVVSSLSRRVFLSGAATVGAIGVGALTLQKSANANAPMAIPPTDPPLRSEALPDLVAAARQEGRLTLIAVPSTWANYGAIISAFESEYGIPVTVQSPNATSAQELTALRLMRGQQRLPDVIEVGPSFARQAVEQGLVQPYKCTAWDQIPADLKHPDGLWTAPYYGLIAFGVNASRVPDPPRTWADLGKPAYRGMVATNGDPRQATSPLNAVWAAALANGGSLGDISPGIDYFGKLRRQGNYIPLQANVGNLANQQVLIGIDWSFNMPGAAAVLEKSGLALSATVPGDGVMGGMYCDAISNGAPHPNAAKLWIEWLTSGQGALLYLDGGAIPALYPQFVDKGKVPDDVQAKLPALEELRALQFPTKDQTAAATAAIGAQWNRAVG